VKTVSKAKITVSIDIELILWVDQQVKKGTFKSRSQGIQRCMEHMMEERM